MLPWWKDRCLQSLRKRTRKYTWTKRANISYKYHFLRMLGHDHCASNPTYREARRRPWTDRQGTWPPRPTALPLSWRPLHCRVRGHGHYLNHCPTLGSTHAQGRSRWGWACVQNASWSAHNRTLVVIERREIGSEGQSQGQAQWEKLELLVSAEPQACCVIWGQPPPLPAHTAFRVLASPPSMIYMRNACGPTQ